MAQETTLTASPSAALTRVMPLWRLAFRPFFLLGALFSLLAILAWGAFWHGSLWLAPRGGMVWWHQHEMLFGFVAAIVAGFLLTAVQNWTGQRGVQGLPLLALVALWLVGRALMAFPAWLPAPWPMLVDLSFLPVVATLLATRVIRMRQWRNLVFVPLLGLLTLANGLMHAALIVGEGALVRHGAYLAVLLVTLMMVILGGRVIPFFTSRRLNRPQASRSAWLEALAIGGVASLVLATLAAAAGLALPSWLWAGLSLLAAAANLGRLLRWEGLRCLHEPLLWGLHASYAFVVAGLAMWGLAALDVLASTSLAIHALTVGGMGSMILAMVARVSLGHTGRPIQTLPGIGLALGLMLLAAVLRALIPALWPQVSHWTLGLSILCWCLAYVLFLGRYTPMLLKARADGQAG